MLSIDHWFHIIFIASMVTCTWVLIRTVYDDDKIRHIIKGVGL